MQSYPEFPNLRGMLGASQKNDLKSYLLHMSPIPQTNISERTSLEARYILLALIADILGLANSDDCFKIIKSFGR